jgi:hypothetical protein
MIVVAAPTAKEPVLPQVLRDEVGVRADAVPAAKNAAPEMASRAVPV